MRTLSLPQARKLALLSQCISTRSLKGSAYTETLNVFERLGYVQIDTISVVQRAHHHTLWSRNPRYQVAHLDQLVADKKVFEYWSHAASYLPMRDYRFSLPRKTALKMGQQSHWYKKDHKLMADVLQRIESEGPLMAKDFVSKSHKTNGWGSKPSKQALETLFMQGDLMIAERKNFHKVYDLTQRVLPNDVDASIPTEQEHGQFLVLSYLRAHGFGNLAEITYLLKNVKTLASQALNVLLERGDIKRVIINEFVYFACCDALLLLDKRLNKKQVHILSPFDNLLIQRKRTQSIFNYKYLLECYVPAAKRQFGYFCLPVVWDGTLVARADCKVDKQTSTLNVIHLFIESSVKEKEIFFTALEEKLQAFAQFNQCSHYAIQKASTHKCI
ncbi:winged helix-turn-helix domain-containing protein [Photobacterium profundum]|uniref:winged helix-turn-helix domain-containing protein n=1 Tax=Photobacterium profundum TaxID=74109 RepID=UPI003D0DE3D9